MEREGILKGHLFTFILYTYSRIGWALEKFVSLLTIASTS